ncbi:MAG: allantoinase PuuE [SAR202 cluster bacterium]|jgi:peptidoglycan/xylan/chitin deacetylase (PgdA/CDA1 family)|nr:allantoinase [Chloroflexota bacterium]MDP6420339.1 allantoinase PuuE [SAR202 cluster bacterium]HAL49041.1 allantoinase [Dehalococcoidia bacterium]MDP6665389.1 allantoinase PuuE [SAR202 cluster bacterium]MDP6800109.1 allantoinase PuuE [SAR202 cluster bacterium]|tara:strand:+ start:8661 stop:9548 length:888 start_codon:yes stop_codon:yes gene_type:complete
MNERDFIGYGPNPPKIEWPDGARVALSVVVNYEEGSEYSLLDGDPHRETNNEVPSPLALDERDLANESFFEYGSRVGVWRILNILGDYNVPATFFCCALALERNPEVGPEIVRRGHEVFGHGYRWEEYFNMDRDDEREAIAKTIESLKRTTGQRPLGWYTRYGPSVNTRELVVEEGGFLYDSNSYSDDLPYYTNVNGKKWLVVPYSLEVNDTKFWRGGMVTPNDFYETARNTLDVLYSEGASRPKMMSVGLHCRIIGRPSRAAALKQFLDYATSLPGVWITRRVDIARWWLEKYP